MSEPLFVPPAINIMRKLGMEPDPWQADVLEGGHQRLLLNCCRQAGKSTAVAALALVEALWRSDSLVLLLSRSQRQSAELFRTLATFYARLRSPLCHRQTAHELEFTNRSRIVSLPCSPDTVRGFAHVTMLVIDEAARVPDELYRTVRPMLAVSGGRLICLSTPRGKQGFFYEAWAKGGPEWRRIEVPADQVRRIRPEFLEEERRTLSPAWFRQEYGCSFEALAGLVYPDFDTCLVDALPAALAEGGPAASGYRYGGLDFCFTDPFAAVWGVLDRQGVLWLTHEHYVAGKPLSFHAQFLPKGPTWYADPSQPGLITELRCAGFGVSKANNARELGIMAVSARIAHGTLKVHKARCPNLLAESRAYHYRTDEDGRQGATDGPDHALDALRYLVCRLDWRRLARGPRPPVPDGAPAGLPAELVIPPAKNDHGDIDLSEQFLYWACKQHDGSPDAEGTWLAVAFDRLYQDGVCLEGTWPYYPDPIPGNEGQGPPPAGAVLAAMDYRIANYVTLGARAVADIKQILASGRCVAFSVPVYNTLMKNPQAMKTGKIPNPVPGELPVGGHAMCFVGYEDESGTPGLGGGRFILKNSWDGNFAFASAYGPGYGTIPYAYIARLGKEAFALA
jgi:hypothetical protein